MFETLDFHNVAFYFMRLDFFVNDIELTVLEQNKLNGASIPME